MPVTTRIITADKRIDQKAMSTLQRAEIDPAVKIIDEKALLRRETL